MFRLMGQKIAKEAAQKAAQLAQEAAQKAAQATKQAVVKRAAQATSEDVSAIKVTDRRGQPFKNDKPYIFQTEQPNTLADLKNIVNRSQGDLNEARQLELFAKSPKAKQVARDNVKSKQDAFEQAKKDFEQAKKDKLSEDSNENYRRSNELQEDSNQSRKLDIEVRQHYVRVAQTRNVLMAATLVASAAYFGKYMIERDDEMRKLIATYSKLEGDLRVRIEKLSVDKEKLLSKQQELAHAERGGSLSILFKGNSAEIQKIREAITQFEDRIKKDKNHIHEVKNEIYVQIMALQDQLERNENSPFCESLGKFSGQSKDQLLEQHKRLVDAYMLALEALKQPRDVKDLAIKGIKNLQIAESDVEAVASVEERSDEQFRQLRAL